MALRVLCRIKWFASRPFQMQPRAYLQESESLTAGLIHKRISRSRWSVFRATRGLLAGTPVQAQVGNRQARECDLHSSAAVLYEGDRAYSLFFKR